VGGKAASKLNAFDWVSTFAFAELDSSALSFTVSCFSLIGGDFVVSAAPFEVAVGDCDGRRTFPVVEAKINIAFLKALKYK
jgi:hypothetical protein